MPWPEVQPLPILVPKPVRSPAAASQSDGARANQAGAVTSAAGLPAGPPTPRPGTRYAAASAPSDQEDEEDEPPDHRAVRWQQLAEYPRDAGDAAIAEPQDRRRQPDQGAADAGGNGSEVFHGRTP